MRGLRGSQSAVEPGGEVDKRMMPQPRGSVVSAGC